MSEDGQVSTLESLLDELPKMPPTLFVAMGAADVVAWFDEFYSVQDPDHWQWCARDSEQAIHVPGQTRRARRVTTIINYLSFREGGLAPARVSHLIIDPVNFYERRFSEVWSHDEGRLIDLLKWAITLRDFCKDSGVKISPSRGGIGGQFLTDPRFYPEARRKVPVQTNELARQHLPGQHYRMGVSLPATRDYHALCLDQRRAYHYHAARLAFPDANFLYAAGRFHTLGNPYRTNVTPGRFMGLYCLDLAHPHSRVAHSWLDHDDLTKRFVYSNELPHLLDMGYTVTGVRAAWGSPVREKAPGLNAYAKWANEQLDQYGNPAWLKPLLLTTYGTLACTPKYRETVFKLTKAGEPCILFTGKGRLHGNRIRSRCKIEPGIANVIHLGMIHAATRSESVGLAQWLGSMGQRILKIDADAVFVEVNDDKPLPELPEPWRVDKEHTHWVPENERAWRSDQAAQRPGVPRGKFVKVNSPRVIK